MPQPHSSRRKQVPAPQGNHLSGILLQKNTTWLFDTISRRLFSVYNVAVEPVHDQQWRDPPPGIQRVKRWTDQPARPLDPRLKLTALGRARAGKENNFLVPQLVHEQCSLHAPVSTLALFHYAAPKLFSLPARARPSAVSFSLGSNGLAGWSVQRFTRWIPGGGSLHCWSWTGSTATLYTENSLREIGSKRQVVFFCSSIPERRLPLRDAYLLSVRRGRLGPDELLIFNDWTCKIIEKTSRAWAIAKHAY